MRRLFLPLAIVITIIFAGLALLGSVPSVEKGCKSSIQGSCCKKQSKPINKEIMLENFSRQFISVAPW
jgi:hypothetical protein